MAVPDFQSFMLPLVRFVAGKFPRDISVRELGDGLAAELKLTDEDRVQRVPSGQTTFGNRVAWACTHLRKAGLLVSTERGRVRATERAQEVIAAGTTRIDLRFLDRFPEHVAFRSERAVKAATTRGETTGDDETLATKTPQEILEAGYQTLRAALASDLLQRTKECSPGFFEQLVVELLVKMGYGGSRTDAGKAIGKSGDGGIDGIIKEDRLGLDSIFIQAKRWTDKAVSRPDVQQLPGHSPGTARARGFFSQLPTSRRKPPITLPVCATARSCSSTATNWRN